MYYFSNQKMIVGKYIIMSDKLEGKTVKTGILVSTVTARHEVMRSTISNDREKKGVNRHEAKMD